MQKPLKDILEFINARFPIGRHCNRIKDMLDEKIDFDYQEVIKHLIGIKEFGGSDGKYTNIDDIIEADLQLNQLKEFVSKNIITK